MKVFCYVSDKLTNFGDDLNRWLWNRLPGFPPDEDDGTLFLGIGTIISRDLVPPSRRYIVLSSGVGYDPLPVDFGDPRWEILSVRGPLTASVLGLPPEKAIVDGAVLLRFLPECRPLPASERAGIVFMPHYESLELGNWRQVCEMAGFEFLDPLADSEETVQRIRKAKLVIADAMHAAIVADALRVPWIPVVLGPRSNTFKWLDWTLSLNLPYKPATVPASTLLESAHNNSLYFCGGRFFLNHRTPTRAIEHYKRVRRLKAWEHWGFWRRRMGITYNIPRRVYTSPVFSGFKRQEDEARTYRAAEQLRRIATTSSYLSDDNLLMSKADQIASLLRKLKP